MATGASRVRAVLVCMLCRLIAVHAQSFTVKAIGQLSPLADSANSLSVTLVTDTDLSGAEGSEITISGLSGAVMKSITGGDQTSIPLQGGADLDAFSDGVLKIKGRGAWDPAGVLTLTVSEDRNVTAGTTYAFGFNTRNPPHAMASPVVTISASGSATIAPTAMTKPGTPIHGVVRGADPLTVAIPIFNIRAIGQSTPVPAAVNTLTVTLEATYNLEEGSTVTISGLTGSQTADTAGLGVTSTGGRLGSSGEWSQSEGRLVLRAASGGTKAGTACVVTFALTNPSTPQSSPPVSVEAALASQDSQIGVIYAAALTDAGSYRRPLVVVRPEFSVLRAEQGSCLTSSSNQLDIDFQLMFDLPAHSCFTLHGLHGVQEAEGSRLPLQSALPLSFVDPYCIFSGGAATMKTRSLVPALTSVSLSVTLRNGPNEQRSPGALSASVRVELGQNMSSIEVQQTDAEAPSQQLLWGIPTCKRALVMIEPRILSSAIYQSNPLALASNTFTVNFDLNVEMTRGSIISITGLQDTCTPKSGFVQVQALSERRLDLIASWGKTASLQLALLVHIGWSGASNQSMHSLTMNLQLQNCHYARRYRPLMIGGYILPPGGQLPQDGSPLNGGLMLEMSTIRQPREGVQDGSLPLLVVVPTMETKIILQSNPFAGQDNTLTVTLASTVNMSPHSHITLQGFRGIRDGSGDMNITCSPGVAQTKTSLYSLWIRNNSELILFKRHRLRIGFIWS